MGGEIGMKPGGKVVGQRSGIRNRDHRIDTLEEATAAIRQGSIGNHCESPGPPDMFEEGSNGGDLLRQGALAGIGEDVAW